MSCSRRLVSADTSPSVAVGNDATGDVYVIGDFSQTASLGGSTFEMGMGSHIYVAGYTSSGAHRFSMGFGSIPNVVWFSISTLGDDQVIAAGSFGDTLDVGGDSITAEASLNGFLLRLSP